MKTKTLIIVALAFAAGGTCPSDVDNDGNVGINDFLQVLGDWGECPGAPKIVDITSSRASNDTVDGNLVVRLWSDGTTEWRAYNTDGPKTWEMLPVNPNAPEGAAPVAIDGSHTYYQSPFEYIRFFRTWSDGTTDMLQIRYVQGGTFSTVFPWVNLPE